MADVSGFDLSHFNTFRRHVPMPVMLRGAKHRFLGEPQLLASLDFTAGPMAPEQYSASIGCTEDGTWHAVAVWYELDLCPGITISTHPSNKDCLQAMQYLPQPRPVTAGSPLEVQAVIVDGNMRLRFNEQVTPAVGEGANLLKWHWGMVNDVSRNGAYDRALQKALAKLPNALVLDIGAGSGLLSMMSARAGAEQVVTFEAVDALIPIARNIIEANGYGDKVKVVNKMSTDGAVGPGLDLERKADLLVSEIVDVGLLGEHMLSTVEHAIPNLLKPNAVMIPASAAVYAVLLQIRPQAGIPGQAQLGQGLYLAELEKAPSEGYQQLRLQDYEHTYMSQVFEVFSFDFYKSCGDAQQKEISVPVTSDGVCDAVAFWFDLNLDEEISIHTAPVEPGEEDTCWMQAVVWNPGSDEERTLAAGQSVVVGAAHDGLRITFDVKFATKS